MIIPNNQMMTPFLDQMMMIFFGGEEVKEDSMVYSFLYSVMLFVKHFINIFKSFFDFFL